MSYFKFSEEDIIFNTLKTHPESHFYLYTSTSGNRTRLIYNNQKEVFGSFAATYDAENKQLEAPNVRHHPGGFISLYELNVDRPYNVGSASPDIINSFITKDGSLASFSTVNTSEFNSDFSYGDEITGSYPMTASISTQSVASGEIVGTVPAGNSDNRLYRDALRTTFRYNSRTSNRFIYETGLQDLYPGSPGWSDHSFRMVQIPSIFYGEKIRKGTVKLQWYYRGHLVGTLEDTKQNGELIVTKGEDTQIGKFAGLVFYSEGVIILTNFSPIDVVSGKTWRNFMEDLEDYHEVHSYTGADDPDAAKAEKAASDVYTDSGDADSYPDATSTVGDNQSSYSLYFKGTHTIPTYTMMATLNRDECTHSNNPTYMDADYDWTVLETEPALQSLNPATFRVPTGRLGTIGSTVEGKIEGYVESDNANRFLNKDLRFKIISETDFQVYRVNDAGNLVAITVIDANSPSAANISIKQNAYTRQNVLAGQYGYIEPDFLKIKNTTKSAYSDPYAEYEDNTYISKIGIYDEDRNLIGIAKLATPVKKINSRDFTFKLKLDL